MCDFSYDKDASDGDDANDNEYVLSLYEDVNTYEDLLKVNVQFLRNEISQTYYYCAEFGELCGENHMGARNALIELHQRGIYTVDGQSNTDKQRGYVTFLCQPELATQLIELLKQDERVYTSYDDPNGEYYDNFPTDDPNRFPVTYHQDDGTVVSSWWRGRDTENRCSNYDMVNVESILEQLPSLGIVCREVNYSVPAEDILLHHVNSIIHG